MDILRISSTQNPRIKHLIALQQKAQLRRSEQRIVVEGARELQHCINAGFKVETVIYCPSLFNFSDLSLPSAEIVEVTPQVYEKIAYRGSTEGVIAIVEPHQLSLNDIDLGEKPLIIVLEGVEKPGNIGAVLRSADAARATAVIVCDPLTDLYNPNLIRSSIGAIFTVPCVACSSDECIKFLKDNKINILTAQLQDSVPYYDTPMQGATAIVMGTEATGLTNAWRQVATAHIRIPMQGQLDSLNVSVSTAILLFEAVRQRLTRGA
ncbi:MAG: RNA methyltransferase [Muribaculaceae bacterium]|nr:RNA methyltransferase [Muribaculaceae bacterium]